MAIGGVVIQFALDTASAVRDLAKFTRETSKIENELDDVDRALDESGREFDQLGDEVDQTLARIKTDMNQLGAAVDGGAVDVDGSTSRMKQDMSEAGSEAGSEFIQNIAEGIGSGQANVQDVLMGTLGGLTNLTASLAGPVGIAAGVAAAGIGLVFQNVKAESDKAKAALDATLGALQGIIDMSSKEAEAAIFQAWTEEAGKTEGKINDIRDVLSLAGVTAEEFQGALAGDPADLQTVTNKLDEQAGKITKKKDNQEALTQEERNYLKLLPMVSSEMMDQTKASWKAKTTQESINDLADGTITKTGRWQDEVFDVNKELENVEGTYNDIPNEKTIRVKWAPDPFPNGIPNSVTAPRASGLGTTTTINVHASGLGLVSSPRELVAMLENHTVRMGRKPGEERRKAW